MEAYEIGIDLTKLNKLVKKDGLSLNYGQFMKMTVFVVDFHSGATCGLIYSHLIGCIQACEKCMSGL